MPLSKVIVLGYPRSGTTWLSKAVRHLGVECEKYHHINPPTIDIPLVFIIRNYKECIKRHLKNYKAHYSGHDIGQYQGSLDNYMDNLAHFEAFEGDKHLIYYEDFIGNQKEIDRLAEFLGVPTKDLSTEFQQSLESYDTSGGTQSGGDMLYHSKTSEQWEIDFLDKRCKHPLTKRYAKED